MSDHAVEDEYQQQGLDSTGHCVNHPQIRVRRPNANGMGWRTILTKGCPLCAVEPIKPLTRRISNGSHALIRRDSNGSSTCRRSTYSEHYEFSNSYCSTSDITATTVASSGSSVSGNSNIDENASLSPSSSRLSKRVLCGRRQVDPATHQDGFNDGQISAESQLLNGTSRLRLHDDAKTLDKDWAKIPMVKRDEPKHWTTTQQDLGRHPSRCRRDSLSRSCHFDFHDIEKQRKDHLSRHPSRSRRGSLSRSCRFADEDDDENSINGDNNSLGSHGDRTVGTYSARESKGSRIPKRSNEPLECRQCRSYVEVKR
eukprot:CCRYP_002645-RA/>CCRYP_002645-RA protein AED:0.18 eAED:0.18 QI:0/-1/0/1/-1/1/1/0/312